MNEETIFAAALEKKTLGERQAFLDEACAGNSELRAAVEELLKADADAGSFLETPPDAMDATIVATAASRDTVNSGAWAKRLSFLDPCDKPGRIGKLVSQVGEYEIMEVVGQGGMGAVLRAFDTKLSRVVAVKVMAPELAANPKAVKRFLREAQAAAAVHHDHVVTIHAVDDAHQPPYIVMQFVEGQTLQEKIDREGTLELRHILRIGSQAAAGLAAAHKMGLIHRDVKPGNILLENGVERVKISDFGLARAVDDMQVTQTGIIAGTPQYMSPEQAKGEPIDARSDLFSLGSVLYTMCAGRPAFRADNPVAVLRRVCDDVPRPIREVNAEIPEWLCEIIDKLLDKKPEQRFQSAQEVADLLAQHLAHFQQPASFPMPPRVESTRPADKLIVADQILSKEARFYWATGILSVVASGIAISGYEQISRGLPLPLATWLIAGGLVALPIGLSIMYAAWQVESRQSLAWAWTAALLSLLPTHPFLVFCLPITIWSLATLRRAQLLRGQAAPQKPSKPSPNHLIIEHPILGLVAVVMLIGSVGIATYLLTASAQRRMAKQSLKVAATSSTDGKWVQLFNGKDLTGWNTLPEQPGDWKVENGILTGRGGLSHLFSEKTYGDFHLRAEVNLQRGDSGIRFRAQRGLSHVSKVTGLKYPVGYEADIIDPNSNHPQGYTGSLRPWAPVMQDLAPMGEWFTLELVARGNHLVTKINGQVAADCSDPDQLHSNGHLALQCGGSGLQTLVRFRKVEIQELGAIANSATSTATRPQPVNLTTWGNFVDPRSDCRLERQQKNVAITVPGGTPHNLLPVAGYNHDAPRLTQEVEGDFTIEVTVSPYEPAKSGTSARDNGVSYRSAGLLVWGDEDNLLRFERSSFGERSDGRPFCASHTFTAFSVPGS